MTAEKIIIKWLMRLAKTNSPWFYTFDMEAEVPVYGKLAHQKIHTASTYSRAFRKLRESNKLDAMGYKLEEITKDTKAKGWKIIKNM
tara:strand:- start:497 stop:757 length:261 start_codon:yes stop_codon:yes gene_type:complete